ncbi:MAG TPA: DUF998 domain-containing protein [Thermoplasmataceae archaeon]|nr:DUF998 domain-containing protein [Thermoplasmataceae archaeon]
MKFSKAFFVAGIIGPLVTIILTVTDTFISPWFSWTQNALSDLGVNRYSYLFNYSLIFEGVMNFLFALGLMNFYGLKKLTVVSLIISGLSLSMVGIFVETYHPFHLVFALVYFILFPLAIIMFSREIGREHPIQSRTGYALSAASLVTIIIGVAVAFGFIGNASIGLAIPEMVEAVLLGGWSVYIGSWSLTMGSQSGASNPLQETEARAHQ